MIHGTQTAEQAQSQEYYTYQVKSRRQSNALILLITTMALWRHELTMYVLRSLLFEFGALCVS